MASLSVDGLVSGLDTTALINKLVTAEGATQTRLRTRMSAAQTAATAYRAVNATFAALRTAAEALTPAALSAARKATSNNPNVTASATSAAVPGTSLTFSVTALSSTQTVVSNSEWTSTAANVRTDAAGNAQEPGWPIEIRNSSGATVGTVDVAPGATLADAITAINAADLGVKAAAIKVGTDRYRLQLTSSTSGTAGAFLVKSATETEAAAGTAFLVTSPAQDATLDLGGGLTASSASNTFSDLMAGVSVTVSKADSATPVTLAVGNDIDGVTAKVQALVDAVNSALTTVKEKSSNAPGSNAPLKGEFRLNALASQVLDAVSSAVGSDGSPAKVGLELTRDGKISFKKETFTAALTATPDLAQRMIAGQAASNGADGVPGGGDDVVAVTGIAGRLLDIANKASDSTTGSIVALANGKDALAKDFEKRIDAGDVRLALRRETLTRQFTAMETALSSLKQQSSWLAGQLSSLAR